MSIHTEALLYSKLSAHGRAVDRARRAVDVWIGKCRRPYVSFSGGKDSCCVLHLVRAISPDVEAVYFDADCAYPECEQLLRSTPNLKRVQADEPLLDTLERYGLFAGAQLDRATMQSTVWSPARRAVADFGFDGMAYGLRAEESAGRKKLAQSRGLLFRHAREGLIACQPIAWWNYIDVWSYLISNNIPYCGTYDRMWDMPRREQRISYWAGETGRERGRYVWLKRNYPELWNRLAERIPDVRSYA